MLPNARDLQIVDSTLTAVGGDVYNQVHNHYHYERKRDIWEILQSVPNFRDIYHDMLERATPGTGMWLIKGDKFRVWLEPNGDIKIFWGSGIPGAGKTVLASIVILHLEALRKRSSGAICVCYIYFRYSQREDVTVCNVLEILIKQTLERHPECQALIENTYSQHLREGSKPTVAQLLALLRELSNRMTCTFYVLDALDEAPTRTQLAVVKTLASLKVKLFITSRPLETVQAKFPEAYTTPIIAQDADLDLHIAKGLDESADLQYLLDQAGPLLKEEIFSTIKENCGGMFLHASLQLDALCECVSVQQVRRTLEAFPSKIEDVYLQTWDRILKQNAENLSLAKAVLVWVLSASRSMTIEELGRAVATSPDTHQFQANRVVPSATLISLCRGLVTADEESRLVRLVHYTAKDTLEELLRDTFSHPQSLLASVCMTHLAERGFQNARFISEREFRRALKMDPLLAYATEAWAFHASAGLNVEGTKHRTARFIQESHAFPAFTSFDGTKYFDILAPLHLVALYRLPMSLIEGGFMGNSNITTIVHQQTPLIVASRSGHEDLVAQLITLPETQVNSVDCNGWSALIRAARAGQEGVVRILLAYPGIQVNLRDNQGYSALVWAAHVGHEGIVKLLLAYPRIKVNLRSNEGYSVLVWAARVGHEGVVKILLAYPGIRVNLRDHNGYSALVWAAYAGHEGIVKLLLTCYRIKVNLRDDKGYSVLVWATHAGREGVVKLLLAHPGIQVDLTDNHGVSVLMRAAHAGQEGVVKLLLGYPGIQVNLRDNNGYSALIWAVDAGPAGVVKILLAYPGIQVSLVDEDGVSALMRAAHYGYQAVVKLLLAMDSVDVNASDKVGDTAIKIAAKGGHEAVIRMLLNVFSVDVTTRSAGDGHTALSIAQKNGHTAIVELLRDFESTKLCVRPPKIGQLSLDDRPNDQGSDSGSDETFYDADEGEGEDVALCSSIHG